MSREDAPRRQGREQRGVEADAQEADSSPQEVQQRQVTWLWEQAHVNRISSNIQIHVTAE